MNSGSTGSVVDSKVVEMSFENRDFEENARQSLSTLDKLKQALNFSNSTKGLEDINDSVKNVNMGTLSKGVTLVKEQFSALDVIARRALENITDRAFSLGSSLAHQFALDPITDGFSEFELKMNSVQTILMSARTKEGLPVTLDLVNQKLDELNTYADKTIYSFSDMTSNIGKFTNAGVDLDTAVKAIQGISNEAALSGANASEASRAMYNFAQALSAGYVKLIDWKSIENANMATVDFKQTLIDTAVELGTVVKKGEDYQSTTKDANGHVSELFNSTKMFNDSLSSQWMNTEVLTTALAKYTDETTDLGKKAFEAATQVKTFSQLMDTLKEAAGSGWAQTWEIMIGDFEESKKLFTYLSDVFGGIIGDSAQARNEILEGAFGAQGKIVTEEDFNNLKLSDSAATGLVKSLKEVAEAKGVAFDPTDIKSFTDSLSKGWLGLDDLKKAFTGVSDAAEDSGGTATKSLDEIHEAAMKVIKGGEGGYSADMTERFKQLTEEGFDAQQVQDYVNELHKLAGGTWNITDAIMAEADATLDLKQSLADKSDEELLALGYTQQEIDELRKLKAQAEETGTPLSDLLAQEDSGPSGRELMFTALQETLKSLGMIINSVRQAFSMVFPPVTVNTITGIINLISKLSKAFLAFTRANKTKIRNIFLGIFSAIDLVIRVVKTFISSSLNALKNAFSGTGEGLLEFLSKIGLLIYQFRNWVIENQIIEKTIGAIISTISKAVSAVINFVKAITSIKGISNAFKIFKNAFKVAFGNLPQTFENAKKSLDNFAKRIKNAFKIFKINKDPKEFFKNIGLSLKQLGKDFLSFKGFKAFAAAFKLVGQSIGNWLKSLGTNSDGSLNAFGKAMVWVRTQATALWNALKAGKDKVVDFVKSFSFAELKAKFEEFKNKVKELGGFKFSNLGEVFKTFKETVGKYFGEKAKGILDPIKQTFSNLWDKIVDGLKNNKVFMTIYNKIKGFIDSIKNLAGNFKIGGIFDTIKNLFSSKGNKEDGGENWISKAIKGISGAIKTLTKFVPSLRSIIALAGALIALVGLKKLKGVIDVFTALPKAQSQELKARAMLEMAAAIDLLVVALGALTFLVAHDGPALLGAIAILAGLMIGLIAMSKILGSGKLDTKAIQRSALAFIAIGAAVLLLAIAMKVIETLDPKKTTKVIIGMAALMGSMLLLMAAMAFIEKKAGGAVKSGISILAAVASMFLILILLKVLEHYKIKNIPRVIKNFGLVLGALSLIFLAMRLTGKQAKNAWKSILAISAALLIMAVALKILSTIPWENMWPAIIGMAALSLMLAGLMAVSKLAKDSYKTVLMLGIVLAALTVSLVALSFIKPENLVKACVALTVMLGVLIGALALISLIGKSLGKEALIGVGLMALLLIGLTAALIVLSGIDATSLVASVASISILLLSLVAALGALTLIGSFGPAALIGMGELAVFIAGFAIVAAAIGALLTYFPDIRTFVEEGIDLLVLLAEGIGRMVGAFLGGMSSEMSESLPQIADNLKIFLEKMQEAAAVGTFDFGPLAEAIAAIALIDFVGFFGSLGSIVNEMTEGKSNTQVFADDLSALATSFAEYQTIMDTVDGIEINTEPLMDALGAITVISLTGFLTSIASLVSELTEGKTNVQVFADDLSALATSFATYQTTMDEVDGIEINTEPLMDALSAVSKITLFGFLNSIANLVSEMTTGKTNVETFASDLEALATGFESYAETMVKFDGITIDTTNLQNIVDTMGTISLTGLVSALGTLLSDEDKTAVETFSTDLTTLADAITEWDTKMTEVGEVEIDSEGIQKVVDAMNSIPKKDLFDAIGSFFGVEDTSFDDFKENAGKLGEAIQAFSDSLGDIDESKLTTAASAAKMIGDLGVSLKNIDLKSGWLSGDTDFGKFGKALVDFGPYLQQFADTVPDPSKVSEIAESTKNIATAGLKMSMVDLTTGDLMDEGKVTAFKEHVDKLIEALKSANDADTSGIDGTVNAVNKLSNVDLVDNTAASDAGKAAGDATAKGIEESSDTMATSMNTAMSGALSSLSQQNSSFQQAGLSAMTAMATGMLQAAKTVNVAASTVAKGGKDAIRNTRDLFKGAGSYVGFGFSSGINSTRSDVVNTASRLAGAAVDAIKARIKSASPSKVTMQLGKYFGEGFVIGIDKYDNRAVEAGSAIGDSARKGLQKAVSTLNQIISDDMDTTPVVRPVLDLSEIQNGADSIDSMLNTSPSLALAGNMGAISNSLNNRLSPNADILSALNSLKGNLNGGNTYIIDGMTYDDGSNITSAVETLFRAARKERRV